MGCNEFRIFCRHPDKICCSWSDQVDGVTSWRQSIFTFYNANLTISSFSVLSSMRFFDFWGHPESLIWSSKTVYTCAKILDYFWFSSTFKMHLCFWSYTSCYRLASFSWFSILCSDPNFNGLRTLSGSYRQSRRFLLAPVVIVAFYQSTYAWSNRCISFINL